jgi:hypothetical protein
MTSTHTRAQALSLEEAAGSRISATAAHPTMPPSGEDGGCAFRAHGPDHPNRRTASSGELQPHQAALPLPRIDVGGGHQFLAGQQVSSIERQCAEQAPIHATFVTDAHTTTACCRSTHSTRYACRSFCFMCFRAFLPRLCSSHCAHVVFTTVHQFMHLAVVSFSGWHQATAPSCPHHTVHALRNTISLLAMSIHSNHPP